MVRRKGWIAAWRDEQVGNPRIVWSEAMGEQQNELIECQPHEKGKATGKGDMPLAGTISAWPPL
jgi:hypothetical protein